MLKFTSDHEWLNVSGTIATVGITDHAQNQLGDVVFIELPKVGRVVAHGEAIAVVESVKAASDVYAPVSGEIVEINEALAGSPEQVNSEPMGAAWFFKIKLSAPQELDALMDEAAYQALIA